MVRIPTHRSPTHPGEMLLEEFLRPMGLTQRELATKLHVPYQRINELVRGRRGVSPGTALRLAKFLALLPLSGLTFNSAGTCTMPSAQRPRN